MNGMSGLTEKLAALAARVQESMESVDFMFGTVVSINSLAVSVEQNLLLPAAVLILSGAVVELVEYEDEESGEIYYVPEHNLQVGEKVLLAKVKGGEAYVVLNRCYAMEVM